MINTSLWLWPQWTMAGLLLFGLATAAAFHGQQRYKYSFPVALIDAAIAIFILSQGGFFK